jgi:uncharacterized membrane protein
MHFLDILTILCIGLLVGVEFSVSAFMNPVVWRLERSAQSEAIRMFAGRLGKAMPPWYIASLLLLIAEAIVHRGRPAGVLMIVASIVWAVVIVGTVLFLVPINNRMIRMDARSFTDEAKQDHARWDRLHRLRVLALGVSFVCFLVGAGM